jgi:branched-chain amino acid transport system ATP-binding protein
VTLLDVKDLTVKFGGITAVDRVDLAVEQGSLVGLIGPNGAGKTTLINAISGLSPPTAGSLTFDGRADGPWPMAQSVHHGIVRTFQQNRVFMGITVRENLRIAAAAGYSGRRVSEAIHDDDTALRPHYDRIAKELPYGLLRQLGLHLALATRPKLLLLDEPAVGLTATEVAHMGGLIRRLHGEGLTILIVEHNVRFLMSLAQRVCVLDRGRLLFDGSPAECQANPDVIDVYLGRQRAHA